MRLSTVTSIDHEHEAVDQVILMIANPSPVTLWGGAATMIKTHLYLGPSPGSKLHSFTFFLPHREGAVPQR